MASCTPSDPLFLHSLVAPSAAAVKSGCHGARATMTVTVTGSQGSRVRGAGACMAASARSTVRVARGAEALTKW